jgi:hypothetical protein
MLKKLSREEYEKRLEYWERHRRKWYVLYFYLGVGICFLLYYTKPYGFDPGTSLFWGALYGIGIPLATMGVLGFIHEKLIGL